MKKPYTFVLNFGYAESGGMSFTPFTSKVSFATAKEALIDLATFFKEQYLLHHAVKLKKCCEANKAKDPAVEFCAKCGRSVVDEEFDAEGYMEYVQSVDGTNCDSFHGDIMDYDQSFRWQCEGLESGKNLRFVYQAESVLATCIGHSPYPDKVTLQRIFKDRTQRKSTSFSFW